MDNFKQHEFNAEWVEDKSGPAIMLTQSDGYCEPQTVLVHPWQFRAVCEHFGVLPSGDAEARRTIATLTRRLLTLADRVGALREFVAMSAEHEPAALVAQAAMLNSLSDLAGEWAEEARAAARSSQDAPEPPQSTGEDLGKGTEAAARKKRPQAQPELI